MLDGGASIFIHRKVSTLGAAWPVAILADDRAVAKLWVGQTAEVDVSPGTHVVTAKLLFGRTRGSMNVTLGPNGTIRLVVFVAMSGRVKLEQDNTADISPSGPPSRIADFARPTSVREVSRQEIVIGEETREIDNSRGVSPIVRTFKISREWTRAYTVDAESARTTSGGAGVDAKVFNVTTQIETVLKAHYSTSNQDRRTFEDEVTITAAARTCSRVTFTWKEIHQLGYVEFESDALTLARIPFQVVVGLTFDQQQIDEGATA